MNHPNRQRVFVSGYNKSGTTMLQQALDAHKKITCPPEHHLTTMVNGFRNTCEHYMRVIEDFDNNTGQQGIKLNMNNLFWKNVKVFTEGLFDENATDKTTVTCIHDNSMVTHHNAFSKLFVDAKWVWIVRDPRAVALSLYNHKIRLEQDSLPEGYSLQSACSAVAQSWAAHITAIEGIVKTQPDQHHVLTYEDLSGAEGKRTLAALFKFLDVPSLPASDIIKGLRVKKAKAKGGFISGKSAKTWRDALTDEDMTVFRTACGPQMTSYGYS